jgi:hypothetical protein
MTMCIHGDQIQTCDTCVNDPSLVYCEICGLVGPCDVMQEHATENHVPKRLPLPLIDEPIHVCSCGRYFHDIGEHLRACHPFRFRELSIVCDHDIFDIYWSNSSTYPFWYCKECIVGTTCRLCNRVLKTEHGAIQHFNDVHVSASSTRMHHYACSFKDCQYTFVSSVSHQYIYNLDYIPRHVMAHLKSKHMQLVYSCPIQSCKFNMLTIRSIQLHYENHHYRYMCALGDNCRLGDWCTTPTQHLLALELHARMVNNRQDARTIYCMKYVDLSDLEFTTCVYPKEEIDRRVQTARKRCELEYAPDPCDLTVPSGETLPSDMWLSIMASMHIDDLFTLTKVNWRIRHLAMMAARPYDKFMFNLKVHCAQACEHVCEHESIYSSSITKRVFRMTECDLMGVRTTSLGAYRLCDIGRVLFNKYTTWSAYREYVRQLDEDIAKRKAQAELEQKQRRQILEHALLTRDKELYLRDDSQMCRSYILGGRGINGETINEIVDIMEEMKWLYKYTAYPDILDAIKREYIMEARWYQLEVIVEQAKTRAVNMYLDQSGIDDVIYNNVPIRLRHRISI